MAVALAAMTALVFGALMKLTSRHPLLDVVALADQRQTVGDGDEFAAGLDAGGVEAAVEDVPHGRYK